ncbi:MAG: hypothetical protein K2P50_04310 [Lachnospiraceae bacterium]|nr:hypothetical protein [Lachnospiraceae bacterium]
MYSNLPNLIIGFHGCDMSTFKNVLYNHEKLKPSHNSYDWLGNGVYFWENSLARAEEWAISYCERHNKKYPNNPPKKPAVIGAVISLGHCLDLTDYGSSDILKNGYEILKLELSLIGKPLPINRNVTGNSDRLLRELDCAVIERIHQYNREKHNRDYDSVRGVFIEGKEVYEDSGIREKTHTQLCIVNPNCIKGYFKPLTPEKEWRIV